MNIVIAPFSGEQVQLLNECQLHIDGELPIHPFTCKNRGDGAHGEEGGDHGVLIATETGWVCPYCDYTQDWAHAMMAKHREQKNGADADDVAVIARFFQPKQHTLEELALSYQRLASQGRAGARVMLECIERRRESLFG